MILDALVLQCLFSESAMYITFLFISTVKNIILKKRLSINDALQKALKNSATRFV